MERSKGNKSNEIVPEVAHLINSDLASSTTTEFDTASVTVTTLDSLTDIAAPWRAEQDKEEQSDDSEESHEAEDDQEEEVPGMSMKEPKVEKVIVGTKEKKALNKAAMQELQRSKAFRAKERMKAKKQRSASKFHNKKTLSKKAKFLRRTKGKAEK